MKVNWKVWGAILAVVMLSAGNAPAAEKWMTGDWHQHTFFTDGANPMADLEIDRSARPPKFTILTGKYTNAPPDFVPVREGAIGKNEYKGVIPQGFRYGLDFQVNSEHGGNRGSRDGFGRHRDDSSSHDLSACNWIELLRDQFPAKEIMYGREWNVPGHEHASTGIILDCEKAIAEFEYRFDHLATDAAGKGRVTGLRWSGKIPSSAYTAANGYPDYSSVLGLNAPHNRAIAGLEWLNDNHPTSSWVHPAHIERAGCGVGGYAIAALRDMNDTAPAVFFGFEGMPGYQKAGNRGGFGPKACGGGTYGGAGAYIAAIGGVWDNLLADGRRVFNFVSSDFHRTLDGFYPGEYAKTYVKVKDNARKDGTYTQQDIVDAMRSGNAFAVHGDLISELDFQVLPESPSCSRGATMGETLTARKGSMITVLIRFKSPAVNHNADVPVVHHVQLIQGKVNSLKAGKFMADGVTPNPAFNAVDGTVAGIVATFDNDAAASGAKWTTDTDGYVVMTFTVPKVRNDMFFRIRGTSLGYGVSVKDAAGRTIYGTDASGSPLLNTPGTNSAAHAWKDLWFYSNPIFVKVKS